MRSAPCRPSEQPCANYTRLGRGRFSRPWCGRPARTVAWDLPLTRHPNGHMQTSLGRTARHGRERVRSLKSQASANRSPESNASFPMVPNVPTVQSMGPCLMGRESSPQHRRQPVPPVPNASRPASRRPYPGRGVGVSPTPARRLISPHSPSSPTVPGPFPVSSRRLYRGRGVGVSPTPTRRLISPHSPSSPTVPGPFPVSSRRLYRGRGVGVSPTPTRRLISPHSPSPPTVPGPFPVSSRRLYRGRDAGVSPTPTRRLIYPPQPSTPSVARSSPCVCAGRLHAGALEGRRQRSPGRSPGKGPPHEHALEGHLNKFASYS
ncbi:hypothetical protein J3R75_000149 [Oligosphaera ethanolica]|uniref:Uncharacterized protein n=1 Tax=Oligosphaera ethanolica TaxID=760260 RepID=A0AAE4AN75_9BACT|nr:hypothetical protein [Oligosphaera ethanolica]